MHNNITNIALAGSGNIAWHLAKVLMLRGYTISGIWSRDYSKAEELAKSCNSRAFKEVSGLRETADLLIIAVPDNAIETVAGSIGDFAGIVVHTAGSVTIDVLKEYFEDFGVFYPLQTFSKATPLVFGEVPLLLEASSLPVMQDLKLLADKLSGKVFEAVSSQRLMLHIAAVFAGNYSNLMYVIGNELLKESNLSTEILYPLILETARKATSGDPQKLQTGPARRNDSKTIGKHIEALASYPEYAELYRNLSRIISNNYN